MGRTVYYDYQGNEVDPPVEPPVVTNADRIRSMSDEELAKAVYRGCATRNCPDGGWKEGMSEADEDKMCVECWLAWLKSPAENAPQNSQNCGEKTEQC